MDCKLPQKKADIGPNQNKRWQGWKPRYGSIIEKLNSFEIIGGPDEKETKSESIYSGFQIDRNSSKKGRLDYEKMRTKNCIKYNIILYFTYTIVYII
jgi:hypothetical protein